MVTKLNAAADLTQISNLTGMEYGNTTLIQGRPLGLITGLTVIGIIKSQAQLDAYKQQLGFYTLQFPYLGIGDPMYKLIVTGPTNNRNFLLKKIVLFYSLLTIYLEERKRRNNHKEKQQNNYKVHTNTKV